MKPRKLVGRDAELAALAALVARVRAGRGGALRIEGPPGVGKSALLDAVPEDLLTLRVTGVESEAALPLAGLEDLAHALGVELPAAPDPAALTRAVAAAVAARAPLVVLVDDLQWMDPATRTAVGYLARRAERLEIGVVAVWSLRGEAPEAWPGVDVLAVAELRRADALALARRGGLAEPVAEALVDAVGGNALALVEAPASLTPAQRAGRALLPEPLPVGERLQRAYAARVAALDAPVREALLLAAVGARTVAPALAAAEDAGLVTLDGGVAFTHPFVRSAVYHAAAPSARRAARRVVAATVAEPERSWQLALAAEGPDEALAARLEAVATGAVSRGDPGSAAAALERAARLSPAPEAATRRALAAAQAALVAGRPLRARALLDDLLPREPGLRADVQLARATAMGLTGQSREALAILEAEAAALAEVDPARAAALLTQACVVLTGPGPAERIAELAARARGLGADVLPGVIEASVLVLMGERSRARELLERYEPVLRGWSPTAPGHEVLTFAALARVWLGDHDEAFETLVRLVDGARAVGAVAPLAAPLAVLAMLHRRLGELDRAAEHADEALEIAEAGAGFGLTMALAAVALVAAQRGDADRCRDAAARMVALGERLELTLTLTFAALALGQLELPEGDAAEHLSRALELTRAYGVREPGFLLIHADLVEALVRAGRRADAERVLAELEGQGAWARAALARGRALLADDASLARCFSAALEAHAPLGMPFEVARTRLAFGERLRRARRRSAAREELEAARDAFAAMGAAGWAARAQRELDAVAGTSADVLTARERAVCDLVASGLTNREVAAKLYLSPRTVEHHLRHVYRKLGVRSRTELAVRRAA
ncbi:MAG TPA: LuxR family transcriptional regulator [Solirubrobacter sp.]|nr:LuxR family transcriptional regulator [Solirubrobacter sp.]